ncbi:MAG: hypothetical protein JWM04_2719 [Verrucomicrobiales bacterium]|nr:hypothetical protein [Verrucomicrobiales bacterium]
MHKSRMLKVTAALASLLILSGCFAPKSNPVVAEKPDAGPQWPGRSDDGSVLLPNQWRLKPVGDQVPLEDFPVNMSVHPSGKYVAVLHSGHGQHGVDIVDIQQKSVTHKFALPESFTGVQFSRDGTRLFCSGASDEVIHTFDFNAGTLTRHETIALRAEKIRGIPCGIAVSSDGKFAYVANVLGHQITKVDLTSKKVVSELEMSVTVSTNAGVIPPSDLDLAAATKRDEAMLDDPQTGNPYPYSCLLDEKRDLLYVSLWADSSVAVIDSKTMKLKAKWAAGPHPNEIVLSSRSQVLYVADANLNTVTAIDTKTGKQVETIYTAIRPKLPPGSTPISLALSRDESILFVANACNNNIAVIDVSSIGKSRSLGFIPVGWYPTSVRVSTDGTRLLVANGKGLISKPNPKGPMVVLPPGSIVEYIGGLFKGTLSIIPLPPRKELESKMIGYTAQAYSCLPDTEKKIAAVSDGNPIPKTIGALSPIKYCVYIVKENRTYDQILGDVKEGNGDASICIFPEAVTPNHHKIARDFVLLDNFYVDGEVSADGHEWTMGAYATDFVERMWPMSYGHNKKGKYSYPAEGYFNIAQPAGGYLWDRAAEANVSYRSYGEFVANGKTTNALNRPKVKTLRGHIDEHYRSFDLDYPDAFRADRFISELKRFEGEGDMPRLQVVRLPNDHTSGGTAGKKTPRALVADNDMALGRIVEALSQSKFWPQLAIFIIEDDAQNGSDHVDAHRTIAFAASPYTRRHVVDSTMYSTTSMLRTMELILGLKPMSQFDSVALPMYNSFTEKPDLTPFKSVPVSVDLNERNKPKTVAAALSQGLDFSREDAADDLILNNAIWKAVRGDDAIMPAPRHAAFLFTHPKADDDD